MGKIPSILISLLGFYAAFANFRDFKRKAVYVIAALAMTAVPSFPMYVRIILAVISFSFAFIRHENRIVSHITRTVLCIYLFILMSTLFNVYLSAVASVILFVLQFISISKFDKYHSITLGSFMAAYLFTNIYFLGTWLLYIIFIVTAALGCWLQKEAISDDRHSTGKRKSADEADKGHAGSELL